MTRIDVLIVIKQRHSLDTDMWLLLATFVTVRRARRPAVSQILPAHVPDVGQSDKINRGGSIRLIPNRHFYDIRTVQIGILT
jgi:hypothetical protein